MPDAFTATVGAVADKAVATVRVYGELTVNVPEPVPLLGAVKLRELQLLFPSTVRVKPLPIMTSALAGGITPPGQGALGTVELQFPLPTVVIGAEKIFVEKIIAIRKRKVLKLFFLLSLITR